MRLYFIAWILFLSTIKTSALAQAVQARYDSPCGYLSTKIYCFGGITNSDANATDSSMVMLDIRSGSGSTLDELKNQWVTVTTNTNGLDIKTRMYTQSMQLPDGKTLLLSGGWNRDYANLVQQTIAFNGEDLSWQGYANYTESPYGNRQIYSASSVYVPNYGVGYYGGIEINYNASWTYPGINVTAYEDPVEKYRYIGYTSMTFLNINQTTKVWSVFPTQSNKSNVFSMYQTSILDTKNNLIYFFGGFYEDSVTTNYVYYTFDKSVIFDVTKGQWSAQSFNGTGPSTRSGHTSTVVGPNQRDVLIFGGENNLNNNRALLDYCFTLNLDTYQWTQQTIISPPNVVMTRTQHSAVVINSETVFIVFGKDTSDLPLLSLLVLNVTNPSNVTLLNNYIDPNAPSVKSSGLSTGATVGIAVGVTAAGLLGIGAIAFFILKKKKTKKMRREALEAEHRRDQQIEEPMHVDWEELEKYVEQPMSATSLSPTSQFAYSPQLNEELTVVDSPGPNNRSPMLIQQGLKLQRPNAVDDDEPIKSYAALQKPDGV